jgi:hypothetical protein
LCVEKSSEQDDFRQNAKYIWEYPDYSDWADAYDDVQKEMGVSTNWRSILEIHNSVECLFGGIKCPTAHGSGAVLFYYRWRALQNIRKLNLTSKYDWFIVTRSDFMYDVPHVPLSLLDSNFAWSPNGEHYFGITDRHLICPTKYIEKALDMLEYMLCFPTMFLDEIGIPIRPTNPESFILAYFKRQNIPVKFVPYFMYIVREIGEKKNPTHVFTPGLQESYMGNSYGIKYANEKKLVDELDIKTPEDWSKYF